MSQDSLSMEELPVGGADGCVSQSLLKRPWACFVACYMIFEGLVDTRTSVEVTLKEFRFTEQKEKILCHNVIM